VVHESPIHWVPTAISKEIKRLGREADHSHSSSAQAKNDGVIPPFPHMSSWHGV
jgi:hypothetical protein